VTARMSLIVVFRPGIELLRVFAGVPVLMSMVTILMIPPLISPPSCSSGLCIRADERPAVRRNGQALHPLWQSAIGCWRKAISSSQWR